MVAEHKSDLIRSLVRVPGSGKNKTLEASCLDLSNVSSLAATVQVPQTLPLALKCPLMVTQESGKETDERTEVDKTVSGKHSVKEMTNKAATKRKFVKTQVKMAVKNNEDEQETRFPTPTRLRIVYMTKEKAKMAFPKEWTENIPARGMSGVSGNHTQPQQSIALYMPVCPTSQLIQQREALLEENKFLKHQLVLFQQLFKDKERLAAVIKRLGIEIPANHTE